MANNVDQPTVAEGCKAMKAKYRTFFNVYYFLCFWLGIVLLNPIMGFVDYDVNPTSGKEEWMFVGSVIMEIIAGCIGVAAGYVLIFIYTSADPRLVNPHLSLGYGKMKTKLIESLAKATPFIFFFSVGCTAGFTKGVWAFFISGLIACVVAFICMSCINLKRHNSNK